MFARESFCQNGVPTSLSSLIVTIIALNLFLGRCKVISRLKPQSVVSAHLRADLFGLRKSMILFAGPSKLSISDTSEMIAFSQWPRSCVTSKLFGLHCRGFGVK